MAEESEAVRLLREALEKAVTVSMTFTHRDKSFTVYAKGLQDARDMLVFVQELVKGIAEKKVLASEVS